MGEEEREGGHHRIEQRARCSGFDATGAKAESLELEAPRPGLPDGALIVIHGRPWWVVLGSGELEIANIIDIRTIRFAKLQAHRDLAFLTLEFP